MKYALFALLTFYESCLVPDPVTPITSAVEQNGGGDPRQADVNSLMLWMESHETLATQLAPQCVQVAAHQPNAHWGASTEGRVCRAVIHASTIAQLRNVTVQAVN